MSGETKGLTGGCACGAIRYKLTENPLIVHACHCRDCQRFTGTAFVTNIWIEREFVETTSTAKPKSYKLKGGSGDAHEVYFCEKCGTYLWSDYRAPNKWFFVRAGTLDEPNPVEPDVHIFTRSKVPWLTLPKDKPAFEAFYQIDKVWSAESKKRLRKTG